jgi:hypothetical protein
MILFAALSVSALASSHREAPLISNDPLADNTDLYAFRSPDDPGTVTIIADYIPFELPEGGPNYFSFGENIRYEIHIDNDAAKKGDEITYRFTFTRTNEDPSTFFNIRLGKQNLKTTYTCQKSTDGGATWTAIVSDGVVPPPNIGPRSIEGAAGLHAASYRSLMTAAIATATTGEKVFCGPVDDPFFVDLGGIFDLGQTRDKNGMGADRARDGLAGFNCHTIALKIPIELLQKNGKPVSMATGILDPDFVIGVWASASRPKITTLRTDGGRPDVSGEWVQVSRLGMPLTNEAVIPIGQKDRWNATTPYDTAELGYAHYFANPELALYMDDSQFGGAVPSFAPLRVQTSALGAFDFRNGKDGLYGKLTSEQRAGTALADDVFGPILLQPAAPRTADILPIFYTGVPNLRPYQLATGKSGNPLAAGKPFINNFLPSLGDMLRLNMAVPPTPRNSQDFSSEGIIQVAVLGLTDPRFNGSTDVQDIPNMDGFPNGRRLEDDVTRIELQAVSGAALAAIGLSYEEPDRLGKVLGYSAGPEKNDMAFSDEWPYLAEPHRGYDYTKQLTTSTVRGDGGGSALGIAAPVGAFVGQNYPNPTQNSTALRFELALPARAEVAVFDIQGNRVATLLDERLDAGSHTARWTPGLDMPAGTYVAELRVAGATTASTKITLVR